MASKNMKRAEISTQNYIITFLLVIGVLVTFGATANGLSLRYANAGVTAIDNTEFDSKYNKITTISTEAEDMEDSIRGGDLGTADSSTTFYGDLFSSIKIVLKSFSAASDMVTSFSSDLGVPAIWTSIIIIGIVITITFGVIKLVFR